MTKASFRVTEGQEVVLEIPPPAASTMPSQNIPISVLHEDDDLVVIDKPAGLVVHPAAGHHDNTLVNALLFQVSGLSGIGGELRPGIVHRLDKDTSGVMVVAKNDATHRRLADAWHSEAVRKEYLALVYGRPRDDRGTIDAPIGRDPNDRKRMAVVAGGRTAITDWEVAEQHRYVSLVRCRLRSGRTHQLRVHLKHLGHPIVGDPVYSGPQWRGIPDRKLQRILAAVDRQMLHAWRLTIDGQTFEAPLPEDMRKVLAELD